MRRNKLVHKNITKLYKDSDINTEFSSNRNLRRKEISKEKDELLYFFTTYAVENGLIETTDPINNYRNNILDLDSFK